MLHQKGIIRYIAERGSHSWDGKVSDVSVPSKDIIYVRPNDSVEDCRAVMALSNKNHLPVLEGHKLLGVVSITGISSLSTRVIQFTPVVDIAALLYSEETKNDGMHHRYIPGESVA